MVATTTKALTFEEAPQFFKELKALGKTIVQCHGTFDLVHPGHVCHLEEAAGLGDVLVVTVTAEAFVNKGPGRPYFDDELRVKSLAALECVDHVVVVPYKAAVEAIECVNPDVYCKGIEYAKPENDATGNIQDDIKTVKALGGQVSYLGSRVFSSTRLLNKRFEVYTPAVKAFCEHLSKTVSADQFRDAVDSFQGLKVLVVGDIIFDRYTTVCVQGLTSKNRILSGRFIKEQTQAGGSLAVFRHLKAFTDSVRLISLVGNEPWVARDLDAYLSPEENGVIYDSSFTSVVKQRFVEPQAEGKELSKLFSTNYLNDGPPEMDLQERVLDRIRQEIKGYDLVVVTDFGHGVLSTCIRELIQAEAPCLALNCQTNSNNHGFNIINRQYQRADIFSLDAAEIKLACGLRNPDFIEELRHLKGQLGAQAAWLTRGAIETIGLSGKEDLCVCPPLEQKIVDAVGAGDAFFAVAALGAVRKLPLALATFMGQLAGAQAVKIVGNKDSISKADLIKSGTTMLSF
tara:strand:+ start:77878 stop:79422 length:1545 start_codon:yes stop_codon:yes gene_type:complete